MTLNDDLILFRDIPVLSHSHISRPFWKDTMLCVAYPVFMILYTVYIVVIAQRALSKVVDLI